MTWFSLPSTQTENKAAFSNSRNAAVWLTGQPQANAAAMLAALGTEIQAFNSYRVEARERFKTLEVFETLGWSSILIIEIMLVASNMI